MAYCRSAAGLLTGLGWYEKVLWSRLGHLWTKAFAYGAVGAMLS